MSLVSQISTAFTRVGTEFKSIRTLIGGSGTATITSLTTTDKTSLVAAINEVKATAGSTSLDGLSDVVITTPTTAHVLRHNGTNFVNVLGTTYYEVAGAAATAQAAAVSTANAYSDTLIAAADAMVFKGVVDASANPNYLAANRGDTYKISVAGKVGGASGTVVEAGDLIICITDSTAAGTQAAVGANWAVVQTNIDGAVTGPASSVATDFATFSGTSGKVLQDSGVTLDTDGALAANSAVRIPSQSAVKSYAQPLDTDLTAIGGLTSAADKLAYATGAGTWALTTFTSAGRALVDDADAAAQRATLSVYSTTEVGDPTTDFAAVFVAALA